MKLPFRFFRGEFNGHYLYKALTCFNGAVKAILDELAYHASVQWKTEEDATAGETPLRDEDLHNIGRIAGVYSDNLLGRTILGSVVFTESHVVNGRQRSERALMDMETGAHRFVRTIQDEYPDDIAAMASPDLRMGLVPEGAEPVGYVPVGTDIYDEGGAVIWENVLYDPPADGTPYVPFYGEKHLVHMEQFVKESPLSPRAFRELLESMSWTRHNGPNLWSFFEITRILAGGIVSDIEIVLMPERYYMVYYRIAPDSMRLDQDRLLSAWLQVIRDKFKLFVPELRTGIIDEPVPEEALSKEGEI
jgi:hypothetical protein